MPNNSQLCQFLLKNGPMYVTSANISGQDPIDISEVLINIFPLVKNVYDSLAESNNKLYLLFYNIYIRWIKKLDNW